MRHRHGYLILLLLTLVLTACGGLASNDVSGTWNGTITNTGAPMTLQLTQDGTSLSGTLSVSGPPALPLTGTAAGNLVSLSYQDTSLSVQIEASVDGSDMKGTLSLNLVDGTSGSSTFTASR